MEENSVGVQMDDGKEIHALGLQHQTCGDSEQSGLHETMGKIVLIKSSYMEGIIGIASAGWWCGCSVYVSYKSQVCK